MNTKRDIVRPLLALAMGLLPFVLFGGSTRRVEVNGAMVAESSLNLLGLGLAVAGIVFAWRSLAAPEETARCDRRWRESPWRPA